MPTNQPIPGWLFDYIQDARDLFGVGGAEWHVNVKLSDKPGHNENADGTCSTDYRYFNASLEFNTRLDEGDAARETVMHEVGHIAMAEIDRVMSDIIDQLPEDRQDFMRQLFEDAEERLLQRLSRSLVRGIRPAGEGE